MALDFLESTFEPTPAFGFVGGPMWNTRIKKTSGGRERRNQNWDAPLHSFTAPFLNIDTDEFLELKDVFMCVGGMEGGFRFRDWLDYQAAGDQIAVSAGGVLQFQLVRVYSFGGRTYTRKIKKPVDDENYQLLAGASLGAASPIASTLDTTTGLATIGGPLADGTKVFWNGLFDVPVRFDTDLMQFSYDNKNATNHSGITLMEDPEA